MTRHVVGAHQVTGTRTWSVARVRGVTASLLALGMGVWILVHQNELFRGPAWTEMYSFIDGRVDVIGWIILVGGLLGMAGLVFRSLPLGIASCVVCIAWFGWMGSFVWYANVTDAPNVSAFLCLYGLLEYSYRFVTIAFPPKRGDPDGIGW